MDSAAILNTLIGTIAGFMFSIALYYFTNKWSEASSKASVVKSLHHEIEFNILFAKNLILNIDDVKDKIKINDKKSPAYVNFKGYQFTFFNRYFNNGYMYNILEPKELFGIERIFQYLNNVQTKDYLNTLIMQWKNDEVDNYLLIDALNFARDQILELTSYNESIAKKLK